MLSTSTVHSYVKTDQYKPRKLNSVQMYSPHMAASLLKIGLMPRKTAIIRVPQLPVHLEPHFFRGYFDGDGSVFATQSDVRKPHTKLTMNVIGNIDFVTQMQGMLVDHLGVRRTKLNIPKHSPLMAYMIYSGTPQVRRIAHWMYDDATIWIG